MITGTGRSTLLLCLSQQFGPCPQVRGFFQIWLFLCGVSLHLYTNRFFFRSLETELLESFQKTLCVCVYRGNWVFSAGFMPFSLTSSFLCAVFVGTTLSPKKQCIKGRQNQNRASLNLSGRTFHMCQDNRTLLLQRRQMTFSGNLLTLISTEISRSSSASLLIYCCCGS